MPENTWIELSLVMPVRPSNLPMVSLTLPLGLTNGCSAPDCSIAESVGTPRSAPALSNGLCQLSVISRLASVSGALTTPESAPSLPQRPPDCLAAPQRPSHPPIPPDCG